MRSSQRESRVVVIEGRPRPTGCCVAQGAVSGKRRRYMVWIGGPGVVRLVAAITRRRQSRVVVVHVARRTWNGEVHSGQRERRVVVIECSRRPTCRVMALRAIGGEGRRYVIWIRGPVVIGLVAAVTRCWQSRVVVIYVARRARNVDMRSGQWEGRCAVIERRSGPRRRCVAGCAGRRKSYRGMGWSVGPVVVGRVTGVAISGHGRVVAVHVALRACHRQVGSGQWKGRAVVIECGRTPAGSRVAK